MPRRAPGWSPSRAAVIAALGLAAVLAGPAAACTTALPPRPIADYRAASIVVAGVVENVDPDLIVKVETRYRGPATARVALHFVAVTGWCAFPFGAPKIGTRVLLAVVDPKDWQWPNGATWVLDAGGKIRDPQVPWTGAPVPRTLAEALQTMGIPPDTAAAVQPLGTGGAPVHDRAPLVLLAAAALLLALARFGGASGRTPGVRGPISAIGEVPFTR